MTIKLHLVHDGGDASLAAIVFIHGLGGGFFTTWKHDLDDDGSFWPGWLSGNFPRFSVFTVDYEAAMTEWRGGHALNIRDRATTLNDYLKHDQRLQGVPLVLIGHSMGGLIAKRMLFDSALDRDVGPLNWIEQTCGVIFVATPHIGSDMVPKSTWKRRLSRTSSATNDMARDDPLLTELDDWYRTDSQGHGIRSWAFKETKDTIGFRIVDADSADPRVTGVKPSLIDGDHIQIAKPKDSSYPLYVSIVGILREVERTLLQAQHAATGVGDQDPSIGDHVDEEDHRHGYLPSEKNPLSGCAELFVQPVQGTNEAAISAIAILRCSRKRMRGDDGGDRSFWLATKGLLMSLHVIDGKVSPKGGVGDYESVGRCKITRPEHNVFRIDPPEDNARLDGLMLDEWLLPIIHALKGRRCSLNVQLGVWGSEPGQSDSSRRD